MPVNSSNGMIEFQFRDTTDDVNTTVELNPFFIPEQVSVSLSGASAGLSVGQASLSVGQVPP